MGSIDKALGMGLECIDFTLGMYMLVSGLMVKAMVVGFILVRMAADMLANSSGVSSMGLATTILEMGMHMLESTSPTKSMGSESINLPMAIDMKELGMRVEGKGLACTHLEMKKPRLATGRMGYLIFQAL